MNYFIRNSHSGISKISESEYLTLIGTNGYRSFVTTKDVTLISNQTEVFSKAYSDLLDNLCYGGAV